MNDEFCNTKLLCLTFNSSKTRSQVDIKNEGECESSNPVQVRTNVSTFSSPSAFYEKTEVSKEGREGGRKEERKREGKEGKLVKRRLHL